MPSVFTVLTALAVVVASAFEIIPTFLIGDNVPRIASVKPYTPLEQYGRDIYVREGCYNCHSQMVRPFVDETVRYGEYSKPGEFVYDHPFQWGSRRIGPDLHRQGGRRSDLWLYRHFEVPTSTSPGSMMPPFPHLITDTIDWDTVQRRIDALAMLNVPYGEVLHRAGAAAKEQAERVAASLAKEGGPVLPPDREILAMIAYMQRLGTDIKAKPADAAAAATTAPSTTTQPVAAKEGI